MENIVNNYVISLYANIRNQAYHGDHLEIYRNTECYVTGTNSIGGQLNFKNKLIEKEITFGLGVG